MRNTVADHCSTILTRFRAWSVLGVVASSRHACAKGKKVCEYRKKSKCDANVSVNIKVVDLPDAVFLLVWNMYWPQQGDGMRYKGRVLGFLL